MSAQHSELSARLIDLFGNQSTADPTKLYGNLTVNPTGTVQVGTGLILPDGYTRAITDMGRNRIINGGMDIWQRSSSVTGSLSGYQAVDRFGCTTGSGSGHNAALSSDVPNNAFAYSWKFTVGTGASPAASNFSGIWQNIEGYNLIDFAYGKSNAQTGILTFWVKSSIAGTYAVGFMNNSLNRNYISTYTITTANTWQQVSIIVPGDITGTWNNQASAGLSICWDLGSGSTYQTSTLNTWQAGQMYGTPSSTKLIATSGATWQLTGVQFEMGSYNSPFERRLITTELSLAQRYYYRFGSSTQADVAAGMINTATSILATITFPVTMRTSPTLSSLNLYGTSVTQLVAGSSSSLSNVSPQAVRLNLGCSGASWTQGQVGIVIAGNGAGGWIAFDAEL